MKTKTEKHVHVKPHCAVCSRPVYAAEKSEYGGIILLKDIPHFIEKNTVICMACKYRMMSLDQYKQMISH